MTSNLNKFEIIQKENKWKPMSLEQEKIIAIASLIEKLKDNNINLSKIFKTSSPGKGKRKVNGMIQKRSCQTVLIWQGEIIVEEARAKR